MGDRPPLGPKPERIHAEERAVALAEALAACTSADIQHRRAWANELKGLILSHGFAPDPEIMAEEKVSAPERDYKADLGHAEILLDALKDALRHAYKEHDSHIVSLICADVSDRSGMVFQPYADGSTNSIPVQPPAATMEVPMACPHCGYASGFSVNTARYTAKCGRCEKRFRIRALPALPANALTLACDRWFEAERELIGLLQPGAEMEALLLEELSVVVKVTRDGNVPLTPNDPSPYKAAVKDEGEPVKEETPRRELPPCFKCDGRGCKHCAGHGFDPAVLDKEPPSQVCPECKGTKKITAGPSKNLELKCHVCAGTGRVH